MFFNNHYLWKIDVWVFLCKNFMKNFCKNFIHMKEGWSVSHFHSEIITILKYAAVF